MDDAFQYIRNHDVLWPVFKVLSMLLVNATLIGSIVAAALVLLWLRRKFDVFLCWLIPPFEVRQERRERRAKRK